VPCTTPTALIPGCICESCKHLRCKQPATKGIASSLLGDKDTWHSCRALLQAWQVQDSCSRAAASNRASSASAKKGMRSNMSLLTTSSEGGVFNSDMAGLQTEGIGNDISFTRRCREMRTQQYSGMGRFYEDTCEPFAGQHRALSCDLDLAEEEQQPQKKRANEADIYPCRGGSGLRQAL